MGPLIEHLPRAAPWADVRAALARGGWSCTARKAEVNALRLKTRKAAKALGLERAYRTDYDGRRQRFTGYLPIGGRCGSELPAGVTPGDVAAVLELRAVTREHLERAFIENTGLAPATRPDSFERWKAAIRDGS